MSSLSMVVGPVSLTPDWLRKRSGIFTELDRQLIQGLENPGTGLTLDQLQLVTKHQHPFEQPRELSPLEQSVASVTKKLRRYFGQSIVVDPLPAAVTAENLAKWAAFGLHPVFLPGEEIAETRNFRKWVKPEKWFYDQMRDFDLEKKLGLPPDSARLRRGWYLADFTVGTDYTDGTQVFVNDPLSALISKLRGAGVVGKHDNTPIGSRFSITNEEWRHRLLPALADVLSGNGIVFRLERAIEFNAIGNVYDNNRGKFNMWAWFDDVFRGGGRLVGGGRDGGGLAGVYYDSASGRRGSIGGRPLGCFV